ncbi:3-hydroxyacyl-CoA dehydrogenase NAD-binding domain-containing protein [Brachybacterium sp. AOP25-B2-12]|uniref:3-hydroxyacyl-CoA dehydrogenase NAD-binding domain-containing protein n=1 Tax=Brachybacterium sp. AOP25-B2-12 TaxID=3457710 RepID=UPI004034877E
MAAIYTEHVTRVLSEDREHEGIGTVAVLTIAPPEGETRPATLGPRSIENLATAITAALDRGETGAIQAIVLTGTDRVFLAGADLSMFADPTAADAVGPMTDLAHQLQQRVRTAEVPILAHLNGAALGGGLEVALMADMRTAAPGVRGIAVPETSLGILPGWGGTTLLTSVVGGEAAVRLILEDPARDRQLTAAQALELGLVDALADDLDAALDGFATFVQAAADEHEEDGFTWTDRPSPIPEEGSAEADALRDALDAAHSPAESRRAWVARLAATGAPAPARALALLDALPGSTLADALDREKQALTELVVSDAAAGSLYAAELLRRGKPGRRPVEGARELKSVGVAGAGLMAAQIAAQLALGLQVPVILRDLDEEIAQRGLAHARDVIAQAAARGHLREDQATQVAGLLSATSDVQDLAGCDLVLEAVPEVLGIKKAVFAELEGVLAPDALLVTNTSSLSVGAMSEDLAHPERVVGLHFFNPVAKMPLVEVIHTDRTDAAVLATGAEVVRRCRKFAVDSADAPGFIVNRLLFRVLSEVLRSLDAGARPSDVDASLDEIGMPMRPLQLLDLVGIAVADHVGKVLADQLGEDRFPVSPGLSSMVERSERFTQKASGSVHPTVAPGVAEAFGTGGQGDGAAVGPQLLRTVLLGLAEESRLMLDEHVIEGPEQIDLAMILGAGFPRHRGGLTPYLDQTGASQEATGQTFHGERFAH